MSNFVKAKQLQVARQFSDIFNNVEFSAQGHCLSVYQDDLEGTIFSYIWRQTSLTFYGKSTASIWCTHFDYSSVDYFDHSELKNLLKSYLCLLQTVQCKTISELSEIMMFFKLELRGLHKRVPQF